MPWKPIIEEPEAGNVFKVIGEIADALHRPPAAWIPRETEMVEPYRLARGATLGLGRSGIALFYAYLARVSQDPLPFEETADRLISEACDTLETVPMSGSLIRGMSGIAWTVQHLQDIIYDGPPQDPAEDPNEEIDRIILDHYSTPQRFDLWEGCIGLGVYALERYSHPLARQLLENLIRQLDKLSTKTHQGITWFTTPQGTQTTTRTAFPEGFYDLGVAHGAAGAISFLARTQALGVLPEITGKLLHGAVSWLLAQQWEHQDGSIFPQFLLPTDNEAVTTSTYGFCHGDLGIAAALAAAAHYSGEDAWKSKATETGKAAIRYLEEAAGKIDLSEPTLCHGSAGFAHMFNRLYQSTGENAFKKAALKWFRHTLDQQQPGTGVAGFSKFGKNDDGEYSRLYDPGFVQGTAGIGLALLAAVTPVEPAWDRTLLLS